MKSILSILTLSLILQSGDVKLVDIKINKEISISLPESMSPMSENEIRQKYHTANRPIATYATSDRRTDLSINVLPTHWQEGDLEIMKRFYRSSLINLYDSVNILKEEIQQFNNRKFLVFEFISTVNPDPDAVIRSATMVTYNYLQYAMGNGRMVLFTFTSPASQKDRWQNTAEQVMHSVKIKKTL